MQHEEGGFTELREAADIAAKRRFNEPCAVMRNTWTGRWHIIMEFAIDKYKAKGYAVELC